MTSTSGCKYSVHFWHALEEERDMLACPPRKSPFPWFAVSVWPIALSITVRTCWRAAETKPSSLSKHFCLLSWQILQSTTRRKS
jgi:hypothetical protein